MKGFLGKSINQNKRQRATAFDRLAAIELLYAINRAKKWTRPSINKEAQAFRLMRERDGITNTEIDEVLRYHCQNLREKFHPRAFSAEAFRKKFQQIAFAHYRMNPKEDDLHLSDQAKGIVKRLKMLGWKKGSLDQLPREVQMSLSNLSDFRNELAEVRKTTTDQRLEQFTRTLLDRIPRNWIESHYQQLHRRLHGWDAWNGELSPFRWSTKSKDVWKVVASILEDYGGHKTGSTITKKLKELFDEG